MDAYTYINATPQECEKTQKDLRGGSSITLHIETCEGCKNLADISCEWYPRMAKEAFTDGLAIWGEKRI